ncbi:DUF4157 domain-containing protein [uncultured Nostoc sp.]|uniref:eCIS core domain-containing protein n=1 Tax=uncultured Nostoc sp. TaxID=340711 RepID=UPI0035C97346
MSKQSGKVQAKSWQPPAVQTASFGFSARPFPEIARKEEGKQASLDLLQMKENQPGGMIDNINRSLASASPPAPLPILRLGGVQAKLTLGTVGDVYEQEADRVARQVVDEIHSSAFRASNTTSEGESIANGGEAGRVQRQITVRAAGDAGGEISSEWEGELVRAKGGGQPMSPTVTEPMERAFGADFGGVRVHTGAQADMLARSIQAKAFTTGQDVFFRQGAYEPGSQGGQELIAHELTHVVQQKREPGQTDTHISTLVQRKGERAALRNTRVTTRNAGEQIRRGNRRGSISSTNGKSSAKLAITYNQSHQHLNTGYRNKVTELKKYVIGRMVDEASYTRKAAEQMINNNNNNNSFIQAKAIEEISVGNCGEFSMVVYAHLVQNTTDQWIHRCSMLGKVPESNTNYDHCFVFTYSQQVNAVSQIRDKAEATIADAWDGYKIVSLVQFMNGENAYGTRLTDTNIDINEAQKATGNQVLPPQVQKYIEDWAQDFNKEFENQIQNPNSTYAKVAKERAHNPQGFNTEGSNVTDIDDRRTLREIINNSTEQEKQEAINNATDTDLFNYINTLSAQGRASFLNHLDHNRLVSYVLKCWNKGILAMFALASSYPYRADVITQLPIHKAIDVLEALPEAERNRVLNDLPQSVRNKYTQDTLLPI